MDNGERAKKERNGRTDEHEKINVHFLSPFQ